MFCSCNTLLSLKINELRDQLSAKDRELAKKDAEIMALREENQRLQAKLRGSGVVDVVGGSG